MKDWVLSAHASQWQLTVKWLRLKPHTQSVSSCQDHFNVISAHYEQEDLPENAQPSQQGPTNSWMSLCLERRCSQRNHHAFHVGMQGSA